MRILQSLAAILIAAITIIGCKKQDDSISKELNPADVNFILSASIDDSAQIAKALVVIAKSSDSVILSFAQNLLAKHKQARNDLKVMGNIVGFTVKDTIDTAHTANINLLKTSTGRAFDSTFIHGAITDHKASINFYKEELNSGMQLNVKRFADTYLQNYAIESQRADSIAAAFY